MTRSVLALAAGAACATAAVLVLAAPATCASFNCAAARTCTEKVICATPQLSVLDDQMASRYFALRALASRAGAQALLSSQRQWLADRDSCGCNANCLLGYYNSRIRLFDNILNY